MNINEHMDAFLQDSVLAVSPEALEQKLRQGRPLKIKMGADPTRPDLHLGHAVLLRKLARLQELGHEIIFVIGDFTAAIGDPTGRNKTRPPLSHEEARVNGQTYFQQVSKILDKDRTAAVYNSQWLNALSSKEMLELAGQYTLARMLEREDFAARFSGHTPISLHELFYPLLQGYDSVAQKADVEVGGTDQTFNLLVGRELQKSHGQAPQAVITYPLLLGLDGKEKMSKSLENHIGLNEAPETMYEKCMRIPDALLEDYFRLTAQLPPAQWQPLLQENIYAAHHLFAGETVRFFHGGPAAAAAQESYRSKASGMVSEKAETVFLEDGQNMIEILKSCGFAASNSQARRLIVSGCVRINDEVITDFTQIIDPADGSIIRCGKGKVKRIVGK